MMKKELTIAPTYVGHNDGCVFVVPAKIFQMKLQGTVDPEDTKTFAQYINKTFTGFEKARKSKYNNEGKTEIESTPEFWEEFERVAKDLGVDLVGYTPVDENFVFKDLQIYGRNGIILAMELQWDQIKTAPGYKCGMEAFRVYQALGDIVLKMTAYLQERGYKAEAHVPFGGTKATGIGERVRVEYLAGDSLRTVAAEFSPDFGHFVFIGGDPDSARAIVFDGGRQLRGEGAPEVLRILRKCKLRG